MTGLYMLTYTGQEGVGVAAICISNGRLLGIDTGHVRYRGSYEEAGGRFKGDVALEASSAMALVTGKVLAPGQFVQFKIDWPKDFANGQPQPVSIMGRKLSVLIEKIGELP